jgi:microsomal dipeptidase-like Zn-dependent dipeptidase
MGRITVTRLPLSLLMVGAMFGAVAVASGGGATRGATARPGSILAHRCFAIASVASGKFVVIAGPDGYRAARKAEGNGTAFYLKPTRLGDYMLYDQRRTLMAVAGTNAVGRAGAPGPAAEWTPLRASKRSFTLRSTASGQVLRAEPGTGKLVLAAADSGDRRRRFELVRDRGCRRFPEARVGVRGKVLKGTRPDGTVFGFADYHLHITADIRAGGRTIYGKNFDRFGIAEALGHDADVHGPNGGLDATGNLLRTGSPVGTHDTNGWPTFTGWPVHDTYTHQQTYYIWLKRAWRAGERLVVAQTVEDQPLCQLEQVRSHSCDETDTIKLEIRRLRRLQRYVDAQSGGRGRGWFRLVYNPRQARRMIERGKLAVVIGMEASDPFGCSELLGEPQCTRADIDSGLHELRRMGLRGMFIAHWIDNAFAGAALEPGANGTFIGAMQQEQTGQPFDTEPCPGPDEADGQCNTKGLTSLGRYLVHRLMAKHMLIEVDHLSQRARKSVMAIAARHHYPLVSSHTGTGGEWTAAQLRRLYDNGGLATATLAEARQLAAKIRRLGSYRSHKHYFGVGLGSDTGGFNALPGPPPKSSHPLHYPFTPFYCDVTVSRETTGQRTFDLNKDGVAHYGLLPDLLADVQQQKGGRRALHPLLHSAEAYLEMWGRAFRFHGGP